MGYSNSIKAVNRMKEYLTQLASAKEPTVVWVTADAHKFRQALHNAMHAAKVNKAPEFESLKEKWVLRVDGSRVIAEMKDKTMFGVTPSAIIASRPVSKMGFPEITDVVEVVGVVIEHDKIDELHFPFFNWNDLAPNAQEKLTEFLRSHNFKVVTLNEGIIVEKIQMDGNNEQAIRSGEDNS